MTNNEIIFRAVKATFSPAQLAQLVTAKDSGIKNRLDARKAPQPI